MTDLTEKQIFGSIPNSNINFLLDVFRIISFKPGYHFQMHNHKRIELNYILQGSCVMMLENELIKLSKNNSILIFPKSNHDFYVDSKQGVKIVQLEFQINEQFATAFNKKNSPEFSCFSNVKTTSKSCLKIPNNLEIGDCMERIIKENKLKRSGFESISKLYFLELTILLSRYINKQVNIAQQQVNEHIITAMNLIHANYCTRFSVSEIAKECNISSRYLQKLFNVHLESTPQEYCNNVRINKAVELLANRNIAIKEIAFSVGYSTPQYFSRMFKEKYGFSPHTYRKILFESQ